MLITPYPFLFINKKKKKNKSILNDLTTNVAIIKKKLFKTIAFKQRTIVL